MNPAVLPPGARALALSAALAAVAVPQLAHAQLTTYDVNLQSAQFTLYTDPYNGNQIKVGGFSGLYPVPGQPDAFYAISDRGPATDYPIPGTNLVVKAFVAPRFGPHIITVRLMPNGSAKIEDVKPLKRPNGGQISGLPTSKPVTDVPFDFDLNQLPYDEDSLDAEGITIDPWGNFWICEEYKPSVAMVAPNGKVQMRLVPAGTLTGREEVPTYDVLPGVLAKRRNNRGFEGITVDSTGMLYAIMQRPLNNPNRAAADANGNGRLVAINLRAALLGSPEPLVRQYLYPFPLANGGVTVSDLFATAPGKILVPERATDKLFIIDVAGATDITELERPDGKLVSDPTKTFEQLNAAGLAALNVVPVTKTVVLDGLTTLDPLLEKIEGVCVVGQTLVMTHDNDFNVAETASTPANPNPKGPFVQLELIGNNYPRLYTLPLP